MPEESPERSRWICRPLLRWIFRPLRWFSLTMSLFAMGCVLTADGVLTFDMLGWVPCFILAHCIFLVFSLSRIEHSSFGYLYVQGHDRDTLFRHVLTASGLSVLCVWLPCALIIWLGVRSGFQQAFGNFNFPLMAPKEYAFPLWCLLAYGVLVPIFHYAWIRGGQSMRGSASGFVLAAAAVLVAFSIWNGVRVPDMPGWTIVAMAGGFVVTALSLLIAARKLHRQLELVS